MSMFGKIKLFVGLQVYQMKKGIFITQSKYITETLKTFGMKESIQVSTTMTTRNKLSLNNIALAFGIVEGFYASTKENHIMVVKMILRYLKGT